MTKQIDGGPAFPFVSWRSPDGMVATDMADGMSLRDWFATHAPAPSAAEIELQVRLDKSRNPFNDAHKPKLRSSREIIADYAYEYADAMLKARAL